jgi:chromosome segregation ATPase
MRYIIVVILLITFLLTGCESGPTPAEQIYVHLEKAVELEAEFENQQDPMVNLEQKEKELYDQIIALGMKEIDKIKQLSNEALTVVEEREMRLQQERESINLSRIEFKKTVDIISLIEDEKVKEMANQLTELMNNRYNSYEELYEAYSASITLDKELYQLFQKEDLTLDELEQQVEKINKSYEQVITLNETFNQYTTEYNTIKKDFYNSAGIEVSYE